MKVAIVNQPWNHAPPAKGGSIAIWTWELARRLANHPSIDELYVYARRNPDQPEYEEVDGVRCVRYPVGNDLRVLKVYRELSRHSDKFGPPFRSDWFYRLYMTEVAADLRRRHVDVAHIHDILRAVRPGEIYVPCEHDTPADHRVTRAVVLEASTGLDEVVVYEYPVWFWFHRPWVAFPLNNRRDFPRVARETTRSVARLLHHLSSAVYIGDVLDQKRKALDAYHCPGTFTRRSADFTANITGAVSPFVSDLRHRINGGAAGISACCGTIGTMRGSDRNFRTRIPGPRPTGWQTTATCASGRIPAGVWWSNDGQSVCVRCLGRHQDRRQKRNQDRQRRLNEYALQRQMSQLPFRTTVRFYGGGQHPRSQLPDARDAGRFAVVSAR